MISDRDFGIAFGTSLLIHLALAPVMALIVHGRAPAPEMIPIEIIDAANKNEPRQREIATTPVPPKPRSEKVIAPKLLSRPLFETPVSSTGHPREETQRKETLPEEPPNVTPLAQTATPSRRGASPGHETADAERSATGAGHLFGDGDVAVAAGREPDRSGKRGMGGGGFGQGGKDDVRGSGTGNAPTSLARPRGGYQLKPRYPESARRAGVQGTTLLKLQVLENGRVGQVLVEQSAGHRDLDNAAAEAVKQWLFEPARMGKDPVAVWVLLPVQFELK